MASEVGGSKSTTDFAGSWAVSGSADFCFERHFQKSLIVERVEQIAAGATDGQLFARVAASDVAWRARREALGESVRAILALSEDRCQASQACPCPS